MIAAFDAAYAADGHASAAALLFFDYPDPAPAAVYAHTLSRAAAYVPGRFYKRELPGILKLIDKIDRPFDEIIIDGYVHLGDKPGLGQHLYDALDRRIPVIGVAKKKFMPFSGAEIFRGNSRRPLFITAAGMDLRTACEKITAMHGSHRIPTLLKLVDRMAREGARKHMG